MGSTSGVRLVVGHWRESPLGPFTDVMLAEPDGTRVLLAPTQEIAEYVAATYRFHRVELGPVVVEGDHQRWRVTAPGLELGLDLGRRPALGWLLRAVPRPLAASPRWTRVTDPVSRVTLRGVRTRGSAGGGRREYYGALDLRRVDALCGRWAGRNLGALAPVSPEPGFGFGSTPERPSVTAVVTTVTVAFRGPQVGDSLCA